MKERVLVNVIAPVDKPEEHDITLHCDIRVITTDTEYLPELIKSFRSRYGEWVQIRLTFLGCSELVPFLENPKR